LWSFSHAFFGRIWNSRNVVCGNQDRPRARNQRIDMAGILPLKLIHAENTGDAYLIITSRFNSFRSSLVLSISSAAFPTMT
jgi:hypothetical protein